MDFGVGFLTNNVMLPILDFFFKIVQDYGWSIVLLTLVVKFALWPLTAKSIQSMRRMQVSQPIMQERQKEIQQKFKNDPTALQQAQAELFKEFGNPLAGCLPVLVQMPILFALFATLRGSPFSDQIYNVNLKVVPATEQLQVEGKAGPHNIYLNTSTHEPVSVEPAGGKVPVGKSVQFKVEDPKGQPFTKLPVKWVVKSGTDKISISDTGLLTAKAEGDVMLEAHVQGIAAEKGFLFIEKIGHVGVFTENKIHWDVLALVVFFGLSLYISQSITSKNMIVQNEQQQLTQKITPPLLTAMFIFFPLPAGVLLYMVISNIFQVVQTIILYREPLPENLQKIKEQLLQKQQMQEAGTGMEIPFEGNSRRAKKTIDVQATEKGNSNTGLNNRKPRKDRKKPE
jgi:YidC/Oxa1 family membrane protein insertase